MSSLFSAPARAVQRAAWARLPVVAFAALMASAALAPSAGAAAFEWESSFAAGGEPGEIATDGAGRVLVPLRGQGRVAMFDNVRRGNQFVRNIGQGILVDPYAVAVDDREDIYVADRGLNAVVVFDALVNNNGAYKVNGTLGGALAQFNEPRGIVTDSLTRAYVAEAGNFRVQVLEVAGSELRELYAFGASDPPAPSMSAPDGVALDTAGRIYVSENLAAPGGLIALYSPQGTSPVQVVPGGTATGQVSSPRGLELDQVNRLLVADSGNNRVSLFNPADTGAAHVDSIGSPGTGDSQFDGPASVSLAPGAMLYVGDNGNGRIARIRFDDADHDNAVDAIDVCPGVPDPKQQDHDGDGAGDECDLDDDGDGVADVLDPCPVTLPVNDRNGDGCNDPVSAADFPARSSRLKPRATVRISGTAQADALGVRNVRVAVARRSGRRCSWLSGPRGKLRRGDCARPRWFSARGSERWIVRLRASGMPPGRYVVHSRARQKSTGLAERTKRAKTSFRILR
jgi:sugar lactone lactonase YvrE